MENAKTERSCQTTRPQRQFPNPTNRFTPISANLSPLVAAGVYSPSSARAGTGSTTAGCGRDRRAGVGAVLMPGTCGVLCWARPRFNRPSRSLVAARRQPSHIHSSEAIGVSRPVLSPSHPEAHDRWTMTLVCCHDGVLVPTVAALPSRTIMTTSLDMRQDCHNLRVTRGRRSVARYRRVQL